MGAGSTLPEVAVTERFASIGPMDEVRATAGDRPGGARLAALLEAAPDLRQAVIDSGEVAGVATGELVTYPYPTVFALWRAALSPAPVVWLTARFLVVQWDEVARRGRRTAAPRRRTLLWGAVDQDRAATTPAALRLGPRTLVPDRLLTTRHGTVLGHLRALGIDAGDVDFVAVDHLQAQDLRRMLGTTRPAPDLGVPDAPLPGWFPNATLVTSHREWESLRQLHPLQAPWYQPETFRDLDPDRVALVDGDAQLGPGVALIATPGHTAGTMSLVLNTTEGVWVSSGNGVAAESYAPRASRIAGLRRHAVEWGHDVVLNANTPERVGDHYDAMVLERSLADPSPEAPFPRCFPLGELTASRFAPGLSPTHVHGHITSGTIRGGSVRTIAVA
ncbi:MAG: hypothetical protein WEB09_05540 [Nitriliruptor sp.]